MNVKNLVKSIIRQFINYHKYKVENGEIDITILKFSDCVFVVLIYCV